MLKELFDNRAFLEGARVEKTKTAKRMLRANKSYEDIILSTELSESEIEEIKKEIESDQ
jgi:hypothetical protein